MTDSLKAALAETARRREKQQAFNAAQRHHPGKHPPRHHRHPRQRLRARPRHRRPRRERRGALSGQGFEGGHRRPRKAHARRRRRPRIRGSRAAARRDQAAGTGRTRRRKPPRSPPARRPVAPRARRGRPTAARGTPAVSARDVCAPRCGRRKVPPCPALRPGARPRTEEPKTAFARHRRDSERDGAGHRRRPAGRPRAARWPWPRPASRSRCTTTARARRPRRSSPQSSRAGGEAIALAADLADEEAVTALLPTRRCCARAGRRAGQQRCGVRERYGCDRERARAGIAISRSTCALRSC